MEETNPNPETLNVKSAQNLKSFVSMEKLQWQWFGY